MLKIFSLLFLMSTALHAQDGTLSWLDKKASPLKSAPSPDGYEDLRFLSGLLKDKQVVGLGEASHGTHEFYLQKARIIKYLVQEEGYRMLALEATSNTIEPLDKFIQYGTGDLKAMLKSMGLYNCEEMYDLCIWMMEYNKTKPEKDKFRLVGIDNEEYWADPYSRDELMAGNFIERQRASQGRTIIWSHNLHIAKDTTMAEFKAMGYYIKEGFGHSFYAIGFDTYKGSVNVLDSNGTFERHAFEGNPLTFSGLFSKVKYGAFFIDFTAEGSPMKDQVNKITNLYSNWSTPVPLPVRLGSDFDGLIFIKETTASIGLE